MLVFLGNFLFQPSHSIVFLSVFSFHTICSSVYIPLFVSLAWKFSLKEKDGKWKSLLSPYVIFSSSM